MQKLNVTEMLYLKSKANILFSGPKLESQGWDKSVHFYYDLNSTLS